MLKKPLIKALKQGDLEQTKEHIGTAAFDDVEVLLALASENPDMECFKVCIDWVLRKRLGMDSEGVLACALMKACGSEKKEYVQYVCSKAKEGSRLEQTALIKSSHNIQLFTRVLNYCEKAKNKEVMGTVLCTILEDKIAYKNACAIIDLMHKHGLSLTKVKAVSNGVEVEYSPFAKALNGEAWDVMDYLLNKEIKIESWMFKSLASKWYLKGEYAPYFKRMLERSEAKGVERIEILNLIKNALVLKEDADAWKSGCLSVMTAWHKDVAEYPIQSIEGNIGKVLMPLGTVIKEVIGLIEEQKQLNKMIEKADMSVVKNKGFRV